MDDFDEINEEKPKKLSPKEFAKKIRKQAYEKAKVKRKEYMQAQKNKPLSEEELARKEAQKIKARDFRKAAYQMLKEKNKKKKVETSNARKEKVAKEECEKREEQLTAQTLEFEKLKLVKFDEKSETFQPLKTPPKLTLLKFDSPADPE